MPLLAFMNFRKNVAYVIPVLRFSVKRGFAAQKIYLCLAQYHSTSIT